MLWAEIIVSGLWQFCSNAGVLRNIYFRQGSDAWAHAILVNHFKLPPSMVIAILLKSRDRLRMKYCEMKYQAKVADNDCRAVRERRVNGRERTLSAEAELDELRKNET